ncbi:hypothetical protein sS8_0102 [Methylocaldum marinum]|uniref:Uncharacterized protein n=1 Tax=Methylocaldum marinum TaxID=1432792 RepID=A0A286P349_9GAMM|nr:hypothetical protein [Methylocaldum marinum]BBA32071.1 hypothetical protein sS8_0102 [Methylocaldum marinum]
MKNRTLRSGNVGTDDPLDRMPEIRLAQFQTAFNAEKLRPGYTHTPFHAFFVDMTTQHFIPVCVRRQISGVVYRPRPNRMTKSGEIAGSGLRRRHRRILKTAGTSL